MNRMNMLPVAYVKTLMSQELKHVEKNKLKKVWDMLERGNIVECTRYNQDFIRDLKSSPLQPMKEINSRDLDKLQRRYGSEPYYKGGVKVIQNGESIARYIHEILSPTKDLNPLAKMNSGGVRKFLRFMKDGSALRGEKMRIELKGRVAKSSKSTKVQVGDHISRTRFTGMFPTNNLVRGERMNNGSMTVYENELVKGDSGVFSIKVWRQPDQEFPGLAPKK